ncbi:MULTISPECIES: DUF4302 domain-containing protein [Niastella]|uniref:DUF4302 domain-containing protein n=1 Tax=Niastella soli TaxID=2821487 RepID=A0ABS3YTI0_9BACT|nr:DUF4302 domain-containing protein [Niastella soli]MBO9201216.1 DUF4302 domain-containing protein [Niastella soli]
MNKNLLYCLLAMILVASCKKDDDTVFDKSPDERINEALKTYQTAITSSQYGWNANLITADGAPYRFYFTFTDSNRVQMFSDFDSTTATDLKESSYRLKALQQPSLIFDTYSYIHILSDPDASVNNGQYGVGLKADFEFAIDTVGADSISLTGRFNGSKMTLYKASQTDRAIWTSKQVANGVVSFKNYWKFLNYWRRLNYRGIDYELQFDTSLKKVTVSWGTGNQAQSVTRGYYFWANGINFTDPVVNGNFTIPGFTITSFTNGATPADQVMNVAVSGTAATIKATYTNSLNPDVKNAVTRWRNQAINSGLYYVSFDGFHKNGVDDAYKLKTLVNDSARYYALLYAPNPTGYSDAFINMYVDTVNEPALVAINGSWVKQTVNSNTGLAKVTEDSVRKNEPWPATGPAADTRAQMYKSGGYYFVQSSAITYDMVSVDDPSVWITWWWVF